MKSSFTEVSKSFGTPARDSLVGLLSASLVDLLTVAVELGVGLVSSAPTVLVVASTPRADTRTIPQESPNLVLRK